MRGLRLGRLALAASLVVLLGSACTPDPVPQPTPTPTASATPPETAQEREQRLAYTSAEKNYSAFRAELNRVLRAGGSSGPTPEMLRTAAGSYLSDFDSAVESYRDGGYRDIGIEKVLYVRPNGYSTDSLVLDVCEDSRAVTTVDKAGKKVGTGELRTARLQVRRIGSVWKLWSGQGERVSACV